MTIIQKHGKGAPIGLLENYQLGWSEDKKELYIGVPTEDGTGKTAIPVTKTVEDRLNDTINEQFTYLNNKVNKGKLRTIDFSALAALKSDEVEENDQFIVTSKDNGANNGDTYLYTIEKKDASFVDPTSPEVDPDDYVLIGDEYVAVRGPVLEFKFHDVIGVDDEHTSDTADRPAADSTSFGVVVYDKNDIDNTVKVDLSQKTHAFLGALQGLGLVGGEGSNDLFNDGFVTGIDSAKLANDSKSISIALKGKKRGADGQWGDAEYEATVIDLNNFTLDEGSWDLN